MKEIQTYSNTPDINKNISVKTIKEGDTFHYRVLERLDNNKYLVNILGNRIRATINEKVSDSGLVRVVRVGKELVLKIVKDSELKDNTTNTQIIQNKYRDVLLDNGIKASYTNINYIETVLKYLDHLGINEKNLLLNFISKGQYFSVNELETIFGQNVYIIMLKSGIFSKIPNTKRLYSDNYKRLVNDITNTTNNATAIKNAIENNGYLAFLLFLLDNLGDEERDIKSRLKLIIKSLSTNRKSNSLKKNVYYLHVPVNINNENKDIKLFIETDRDDKAKLKICFKVFDNNRELFKIDINKVDESYNLLVSIFDEMLYNKYVKNENYLLGEISSIEKRAGFKINVGVAYAC